MRRSDWRKLYDWQRVLLYWKQQGHFGLTLQALGEICQRNPSRILQEMGDAGKGIGGCQCNIIKSPVFTIRYSEDCGKIHWNKVKWYNSYDGEKDDIRVEAKELLERYPWPRYKGLRNKRGLVKFSPALLLEKLQQVADGQHCPFGAEVE